MKGLEKLAVLALGVLAYKNRDRLGEWLGGDAPSAGREGNEPRQGGVFDQIGAGGGLGELLDRFRKVGKGEAVDSWVGNGPNQPIEKTHVESAIDPETLDTLTRQTGLSREEILDRLAVNLPDAVNEMTPEGRLPDQPGEPTLLDPVPSRRT